MKFISSNKAVTPSPIINLEQVASVQLIIDTHNSTIWFNGPGTHASWMYQSAEDAQAEYDKLVNYHLNVQELTK